MEPLDLMDSFWTNLPDFLKSNLNALITQKALAINISLFIIILLLLAIYCIYISIDLAVW